MTSLTKADIKSSTVQTQIENIYPGSPPSAKLPPNSNNIAVKQYHPDFEKITGPESRFSLLLSSDDSSRNPLFRNGCVYVPERDELYVMSDLLQSTNSSALPTILISQVSLRREQHYPQDPICAVKWMKLRPPQSMPMPAGACLFRHGILYCSQGTLASDTGGLWYMEWKRAPGPVLTSYFRKPFNSIQNVVEDREGGLWFTDASTGFELDIRPKPKLPNQVYRVDTHGGNVRVVADGFGRPTGIALSPDGSTLYITDTEAIRSDGSMDPTRAATIYAFDITKRSGSSFLINRRVFAYAVDGVPMAVICDHCGNVYAACGDGVEVWSPGGVLLGLIEVPGGCTSLCFGQKGELFIGAGQRLWVFRLTQQEPTEFRWADLNP